MDATRSTANGSSANAPSTAMGTVGTPAYGNPPPGTLNDDFAAALARLNIDVGDPILHTKQTAGTIQPGDQQVSLNTNVYGLKSESVDIFQYHLDLYKHFSSLKGGISQPKKLPLLPSKVDGSIRKLPDYSTFTNRQNNRKLVDALIAANPQVFGNDPEIFLYDFAATLFSLVELKLPAMELVLDDSTVQQVVKKNFTLTCQIKATGVFSSRNFQDNFGPNLDKHDSATIRFLELATSRYASIHPEEHVMFESKKTSYMNPAKYNMKSPDLGGGKYLVPGASKTVQLVEGPKGAGAPAVVIESRKTPFYHSMNLLQMLSDGVRFDPKNDLSDASYQAADKYLKNLEVFPVYGARQDVPITLKGLGVGNATNNKMIKNGEEISIEEYYQIRYGITLQFPNLTLALGAKKIDGKSPLYPMELLWVADYQRVSNGNITSSDIAAIVKSCAVPPATKNTEVSNCHSSFEFRQDRFLHAAKIQILDKPMQVSARILKAPAIQYRNGQILAPAANGKWRIGRDAKFLHPTKLPKWSAVYLQYRDPNFNFANFFNFVKKYEHEMRTRGMVFQPLNDYDVIEIAATEQAVIKIMKESDEANYRFLLFGHPDGETHLHSFIKGQERKFDVVTQCIKTKTMHNVLQNKMLSLENIVAKTNVKLGGINYDCLLPNSKIEPSMLFIGLGMNHPGGGLGGPPPANPAEGKAHGPSSVLGFAANDGVIPNEFIGNFFLQPVNRDEKVTILDCLVREVLERFIKNRGMPPSHVIFYRSGCSEGAFNQILRYEVPVVRAMLRDMAPDAKFSFIIPSKLHSVRLFNTHINSGAKADEQNIRPGTVVDSGIVSKAFSEFYLNSHLALQGTAKSTKYTILFTDEEDASLDKFERWTNALAYDFQIVTSPTSLPAPVYIANRYAERGRQILNTFQTSEQANREGEVKAAKAAAAAAGIAGNGHATASNSNVASNGNGKARINHASGGLFNEYYLNSTHYNFTKRNLRDKRVNA